MTLAASSVLHYWDARFGAFPVVGGKPVHSRNSAASWMDQQGFLRNAIVNTPRFNWAAIAGERRQVMSLELARTNELADVGLTSASWALTSASRTTGVMGPDGLLNAVTITATGANGQVRNSQSGGAAIRTGALWVRRRTGTGTVQMYLPDGTLQTIAIDSVWRRFQNTGVNSSLQNAGVRCVTSGDAVDIATPTVETGSVATSSIVTASATRLADSFYWDHPPIPQGAMFYVRFVERGTLALNARVLQIGASADTNPRFILYSSGGTYTILHHNGVSSNGASLAAGPNYGDTVELLGNLYSDGKVEIIQSINGAAVTASALSGTLTLPAAWSDTKLWVNSIGPSIVGANDFAEVKIVKFADVVGSTSQTRMDELRALEMSSAGEVIVTGS